MNVFYAMGGGLGHLNRVSVFIRQFQITSYKVITAHPLSKTFFNEEDIIQVPLNVAEDQSRLTEFLRSELSRLMVSAFYIDTFPAGVLGELVSFELIQYKIFYIARRLRWHQYNHFADGIPYNFSKTYLLEELEPIHHQFIRKKSTEEISIRLAYSEPMPTRIPASMIPDQKPIWLIVHTSNKEEVELLHQHAVEIAAIEKSKPFFVVLSDQKIEVPLGFCIAYFPANDWFVLADRIFSAAGFNIIQQMRCFRHKHVCIPFPRKFDDQAWRAQKFKVGEENRDFQN